MTDFYKPLCVQCDEMGDYALGVEQVEGPMGRQWACAKHVNEAGEAGATMWSTEDGIERDATDGTHAERVKPPRRVVAAEPASRKEANGA